MIHPMTDTDRFEIVLKAEGQGPPVEVRLRRWLKASLRGYGLRCVTVKVVEDSAMPIPGEGKAISGVASPRTTFDPSRPSQSPACEPQGNRDRQGRDVPVPLGGRPALGLSAARTSEPVLQTGIDNERDTEKSASKVSMPCVRATPDASIQPPAMTGKGH